MAHDNQRDLHVPHQRRLACENSRFEIFLDDVQNSNGEIIRNNLVAALHDDRPTHFSVVRYGNVVGSRGSVVPFFPFNHLAAVT